jgi:dihydrofolate reductase
MISAIVAVDENWGIGFNGELLEKIPEDMKFFKDLTIGNKNNVVVMGKKTFNSIGKCLPYRENVIISHHGFNNAEFDIRGSMSYWNENYTQTFCRLEIF